LFEWRDQYGAVYIKEVFLKKNSTKQIMNLW
jgi:hypothetical protein